MSESALVIDAASVFRRHLCKSPKGNVHRVHGVDRKGFRIGVLCRSPPTGTVVPGRKVIPPEKRVGFGPRWSATIVELLSVYGDSRRLVQDFVISVFIALLGMVVIC